MAVFSDSITQLAFADAPRLNGGGHARFSDLVTWTQTKRCTKCQDVKPVSEYRAQKGGKYGVRAVCKGCANRYDHDYKQRPEVKAARREYEREYRQRDGMGVVLRDRDLRRRYGITATDYAAMLAAQGGRCALCKTATNVAHMEHFAVDHCHETGRVRGLFA